MKPGQDQVQPAGSKVFHPRFVVLCLTGLILTVGAVWLRPHEPVYNGKPVSRWIRELKIGVKTLEGANQTIVFLANLSAAEVAALKKDDPRVFGIGMNAVMDIQPYPGIAKSIQPQRWAQLAQDPANIAVKSLGAAAVPYLIAKLKRKDTALADRYRSLWARLPGKIKRIVPEPAYPICDRINAAYGLGLIGSDAERAMPYLTNALTDGNNLVRACASETLQKIKQDLAARAGVK